MSAADRTFLLRCLAAPVARFFRANPEIDPDDWLERRFPELLAERPSRR